MLDDTPHTGCEFIPGWHLLRAENNSRNKEMRSSRRVLQSVYITKKKHNRAAHTPSPSSNWLARSSTLLCKVIKRTISINRREGENGPNPVGSISTFQNLCQHPELPPQAPTEGPLYSNLVFLQPVEKSSVHSAIPGKVIGLQDLVNELSGRNIRVDNADGYGNSLHQLECTRPRTEHQ